jgi:hypothetical protein
VLGTGAVNFIYVAANYEPGQNMTGCLIFNNRTFETIGGGTIFDGVTSTVSWNTGNPEGTQSIVFQTNRTAISTICFASPITPPVAAMPIAVPVAMPVSTPTADAPVAGPVDNLFPAPVAGPVFVPVADSPTPPIDAPVADPLPRPVADPLPTPVLSPFFLPVADPLPAPVGAAPVSDPLPAPVADPLVTPPVAAQTITVTIGETGNNVFIEWFGTLDVLPPTQIDGGNFSPNFLSGGTTMGVLATPRFNCK